MLQLNLQNPIGLNDFVLLEDFTNQDAFIENLRIRYDSDIIYVNFLKIDLL